MTLLNFIFCLETGGFCHRSGGNGWMWDTLIVVVGHYAQSAAVGVAGAYRDSDLWARLPWRPTQQSSFKT